MTLVTSDPATRPSDPARGSRRAELAALLDLDPAGLTDQTHLTDDLALDSLTMMRIIVWLEGHGVSAGPGWAPPSRVGDLLTLADTVAESKLSIRMITGARLRPASPTDLPTPARPPADPLAPVFAGNGVHMLPVRPDDLGFLYALAALPETGFRWRYRGVPPSVEEFARDLWKGVLVQCIVRRDGDDEPVGHVVAYTADPHARFCHVGAVFAAPFTGTGLAAYTVAMFVRYLFHTFPFVKVYLEIPGYNWPQVSSGAVVDFEVEGVLREHHWYAGRTWDQYLCAVYRDPAARPPQ